MCSRGRCAAKGSWARGSEPSSGRGASPPGAVLVPVAAAAPGGEAEGQTSQTALSGALPTSDDLEQSHSHLGEAKPGRRLSITERDLWV